MTSPRDTGPRDGESIGRDDDDDDATGDMSAASSAAGARAERDLAASVTTRVLRADLALIGELERTLGRQRAFWLAGVEDATRLRDQERIVVALGLLFATAIVVASRIGDIAPLPTALVALATPAFVAYVSLLRQRPRVWQFCSALVAGSDSYRGCAPVFGALAGLPRCRLCGARVAGWGVRTHRGARAHTHAREPLIALANVHARCASVEFVRGTETLRETTRQQRAALEAQLAAHDALDGALALAEAEDAADERAIERAMRQERERLG